MEVFGDEKQLCPCYEEYQEFQKLVELKDSGLVVYCHRPRTEDIRQAEAVESAVNTSRDVFILYNKKNVKLTTSELISELEKQNISCPRCRKIFEHAQKLIQEVKSIHNKILMGICDHCRKKTQKPQGSKQTFCVCDKIVKKFISVKGEEKGDTIFISKMLPLEMGHLRKDRPSMDAKEALKRRHDLSLRQMMRHEKDAGVPYFVSKRPDIYETPKIAPWTQKDPTSKYYVESEMDIPTLKHDRGPRGVMRHEKDAGVPYFVSKRPDIYETPKIAPWTQKDPTSKYYVESEMDIPPLNHDRGPRGVMRHEKDAGVPYFVSKRPDIYETPKIAPWTQKDPTSKYYVESEMDIPTLKHDRGPRGARSTADLDYVSNRDVKFRSIRASQDSFIAPKKADKYHHDEIKQGLYDSEEGPKKVKKLEDRHIVDGELKLQRSVDEISHKTKKPEQHVAKSKSGPFDSMRNVIKHQNSFFFPKVMEKEENKIKIDVSSSQLIKDTQEKLRLQTEREKKRQEEEQRQKKLEQAQKKKPAREEQKLEAEEKKRQQQSKLEEEQKKLAEQKYSEKEYKVRGKISKEPVVATKHVKPKIKGADKVTEKRSKDLKPGTEQKEKMNEVSVKAEKLKREKTDKENLKTRKPQAAKELDELSKTEKASKKTEKASEGLSKTEKASKALSKTEKASEALSKTEKASKALSKTEKASKKTRDASDAVVVSISNIQKSLKNEKSGKEETHIVKLGKGKESEAQTLKKEPPIARAKISEIKTLKAEHLIEKLLKDKLLKDKQQLEHKEAERNAKNEVTIDKKRIKILKEHSGANLELVKLKGAAGMDPKVVKIHKCNHPHSGQKSSLCELCNNSELELEVISFDNKKNLTTDKTDIIIGEKIFKYKPSFEKIQEPEGVPLLFQKEFCVESDQKLKEIVQITPQETKPEHVLLTKMEMMEGTGVTRYALSDRTFIDKGWTMLPTEKVMQKMNVYRMRPAHPEFDWFEHNKNKRLMTYDTGERLAEFDDNGRGRWYYRNGRLALDYYDAEGGYLLDFYLNIVSGNRVSIKTNAKQRFVVYSSGEPDERGRTHPITILATFDYQGNGIVLDHAGKIRLKYNQTEGVVLDRGIGPVSHWKWHSLNDPPVLQQVMIDTQVALKDPNILKLGTPEDDNTPRRDNEEMLAIEFDNYIKDKCKKLSQKFKPFQIRMKALKINKHFSLKVLDQATVYLIFRDGSTNLKLNIGMILDHKEIVDTDTTEMGEVSSNLERFPARSDSLAALQRSVAHAQSYERQHAERERWLRPPEPYASADQLTAAASPPMRLPLRTVPTRSSSCIGCSIRKPTNNLYYDTRLRC